LTPAAAGSGCASRQAPKPPSTSSTTAPPATARRPSAGRPASNIVSNDRPCTPTNAAACKGSASKAQTLPIRFHGKPVNRKPRNSSITTQAAASASQRGQPGRANHATMAASAI
jgi:hypothetical protein